MKRILLVVLILVAGCTKDQSSTKPEIPDVVNVPVPTTIEPIKFNRPPLRLESITDSTPREEVKSAYVNAIEQLMIYSEFLEGIIATYATPELKKAVENPEDQ